MATLTVALCLACVQGLGILVALAFRDGQVATLAILLVAASATMTGSILGLADPALRARGTAGLALVAVGQLVVCAVIAVEVGQAWADARALGVDGTWVAFLGVLLLGCAAVAFAAVAVWRPTPRQVGGLVVTGLVVLAGLGVTVAGAAVEATNADCDRFAFDHARWTTQIDQRPQMAYTLIDCDALIGRSRAEVLDMLGPPAIGGPEANAWPLNGDSLTVSFGPGGRVDRASTAYAD